ncbi:unnamed protein product [Notodromas monacha]|uniref:Uncharacterized protein n=1 Tax=Notodromas monacha TaxID=399045 RepID=A0A7R9BP16_9CRUS|nr:unnamed protein product [Notodromas monacha]CAG0917955.1 unnamed protein product [Notodromas monacha]
MFLSEVSWSNGNFDEPKLDIILRTCAESLAESINLMKEKLHAPHEALDDYLRKKFGVAAVPSNKGVQHVENPYTGQQQPSQPTAPSDGVDSGLEPSPRQGPSHSRSDSDSDSDRDYVRPAPPSSFGKPGPGNDDDEPTIIVTTSTKKTTTFPPYTTTTTTSTTTEKTTTIPPNEALDDYLRKKFGVAAVPSNKGVQHVENPYTGQQQPSQPTAPSDGVDSGLEPSPRQGPSHSRSDSDRDYVRPAPPSSFGKPGPGNDDDEPTIIVTTSTKKTTTFPPYTTTTTTSTTTEKTTTIPPRFCALVKGAETYRIMEGSTVRPGGTPAGCAAPWTAWTARAATPSVRPMSMAPLLTRLIAASASATLAPSSAPSPTKTACRLILYNSTEENLILQARSLDFTDELLVNGTVPSAILWRERNECTPALESLKELINRPDPRIRNTPALSMLKLADVEVRIPAMSNGGATPGLVAGALLATIAAAAVAVHAPPGAT